MDQDREITREELHRLIWSKPTRTAALEFGLSDVGLAKICRKLGVKDPPRGALYDSRGDWLAVLVPAVGRKGLPAISWRKRWPEKLGGRQFEGRG